MNDNILPVKIKRLAHNQDLALPFYATKQSAGVDLLAAVENDITLKSGQSTLVPTGLAIALEAGYEAQVRPRSGLALKHGVTVLNSPGTIDADYRGEIGVVLINHSGQDFVINRGMRIAQMVIARYSACEFIEVSDLDETERGAGGFGSTGTA